MPDPIQLIGELLNKVSAQADVQESPEWYLRSYLVDYKRTLLRRWSSQEIEFATEALMRFCAQALDTHGALYRECAEIAEEGAKVGVQLKAGEGAKVGVQLKAEGR
ncbi:hypothetical protein [Peristeroidobacter agariperforans]|uniref:hypothetical protein n=1 Tax=Peristeroidobacter agariperforans TaxID=268404 RepID=UPI00101C5936|nr:hypothetical protein [Peristeroidobacter agariperforans]